jgi:hypothetical protein
MRYCPECGTEILPNSRFCGNCGLNLESIKTEGPINVNQNSEGSSTLQANVEETVAAEISETVAIPIKKKGRIPAIISILFGVISIFLVSQLNNIYDLATGLLFLGFAGVSILIGIILGIIGRRYRVLTVIALGLNLISLAAVIARFDMIDIVKGISEYQTEVSVVHEEESINDESENNESTDPELIQAVESGNFEQVKGLLESGSDPDITNEYGKTPLYIAASDWEIEIINILLEYGADPNKQDNYGYYPLMGAIYPPPSIEVIEILLDAGADPTIKDNDGRDAMDMAVEYGDKSVIDLLEHYSHLEDIDIASEAGIEGELNASANPLANKIVCEDGGEDGIETYSFNKDNEWTYYRYMDISSQLSYLGIYRCSKDKEKMEVLIDPYKEDANYLNTSMNPNIIFRDNWIYFSTSFSEAGIWKLSPDGKKLYRFNAFENSGSIDIQKVQNGILYYTLDYEEAGEIETNNINEKIR